MAKMKHYVWGQAGYTGIVAARSIAEARKEARDTAPYNPSQWPVSTKKAEPKDISWCRGMGGHVPELEA